MQRRVSATALLAVGGACLLASSLWSPGARSQGRAGGRPETGERRDAKSPAVETKTLVASEPPASFDRYKRLIEQNPFSPRLPRSSAPADPAVAPPSSPVLPPADRLVGPPAPPVVPPPGVTPPPAPPAAPDPLKDWAYTGTVAIGADVYAVFENKASKEGRYLKTGDTLEGAVVEQIGQNEVALMLAGAQRTLPKSSAFNATPLNAGAPAGGPAPGGPSGPGGPTGPGAGPPGRPGGPPRPAGAPTPAAPVAIPAGAMRAPAGVEIKLAVPK